MSTIVIGFLVAAALIGPFIGFGLARRLRRTPHTPPPPPHVAAPHHDPAADDPAADHDDEHHEEEHHDEHARTAAAAPKSFIKQHPFWSTAFVLVFLLVLGGGIAAFVSSEPAMNFVSAQWSVWIQDMLLLLLVACTLAVVGYLGYRIYRTTGEKPVPLSPGVLAANVVAVVMLVGFTFSTWPQITASTWMNFGQASAASVCTGEPWSEPLTTNPEVIRDLTCYLRWDVVAGCVDFYNLGGVILDLRNVCPGDFVGTSTNYGITEARASTGTALLRINWCETPGTTVERC